GWPARAARRPARVATRRTARVLALAGIGDPEKFFATLAEAGIAVAATRSFPDHHRYRRDELAALRAAAARDGLLLLTTEKDLARLAGDDLATPIKALPVTLIFDDEAGLGSLLLGRIARARAQS